MEVGGTKDMLTKVIMTETVDPWWNLAVEEHLLDRVQPGQCALYLWQNQNTVVIGKNQNPWKECRVDLLEREGGKLARRISGGGAVFHDLGNLNFSFLVDREKFNIPSQLEVILSAVRKLGINAQFSGRNDLVVDGRKFSGNAFCYRKHSALHHGTILISLDYHKMVRYLQVPQQKIQSKGIDSVRSRVVNLVDINPGISVEDVREAVMESFRQLYGDFGSVLHADEVIDRQEVERLYGRYSSWEWRFGETPRFNLTMDTRFGWGGIELCLFLEKGTIQDVTVYSDAMDEVFIEMIPQALKGGAFNSQAMAQALRTMDADEGHRRQMLEDIIQWVINKGF